MQLLDHRIEKRRRKMKINQNSIFKRKKRKLDFKMTTKQSINEEQDTLSRATDEKKLGKRAAATTTKPRLVMIDSVKATTKQNKMQLLILNSIILIIVQLICDMSSQRQAITLATTIDSADQTTNTEQQQTVLRQRFASEPGDTFALVGQQAARLSCSVANKRGSLYWYREPQHWISSEKEIFSHKVRYSVEQSSSRPMAASSPDELMLAGAGSGFDLLTTQEKDFFVASAASDQAASNGRSLLSNYTLRIENVTLMDDGQYFCMVSKVDELNPQVRSRSARLEVLQPPSKLEIQAKSLQHHRQDQNEATTTTNNSGDDESSANLDSVSAELQETPLSLQPIEQQQQQQLRRRHHSSLNHTSAQPRATTNSSSGESVAAENHEEEAPVDEEQEQEDEHDGELVSRLVVRESSRIKLDCRANQAKPSAKLVWLDFQRRPIAKLPPKSSSSLLSSNNVSDAEHQHLQQPLFAEELEQIDTEVPRLELISSSISFRVKLEHHNQRLTCQAEHKAFDVRRRVLAEQRKRRRHNHLIRDRNQTQNQTTKEGMLIGDDDAADSSIENFEFLKVRPLKRRTILLEVHHAPIPELKRDLKPGDDSPREGKPLRLICQAQARPMDLRFRWFIDDQLVVNATKSELFIPSLSRQMHLREIKCEVRNSIGANTALIRLAVKYSPQFVTHLLPPSLQPDYHYQQINSFSNQNHHHLKHHNSHHHQQQQQLPKLSHQLALGYQVKQNLTLRCDFDSNPRPGQIKWFKQRSNYDIWQDISPQEADDLIAYGAMRALFKHTPTRSASVGGQESGEQQQQQQFNLNKRHISLHSHNQLHKQQSSVVAVAPPATPSIGLDYEQMSSELLAELELWQSKLQAEEEEELQLRQQQNKSTAPSSSNETSQQTRQLFEQLYSTNELWARPQTTQTTNKISEQIGWLVVARRFRVLHNQNQNMTTGDLGAAYSAADEAAELVLLDHLNDPSTLQQQQPFGNSTAFKTLASQMRLGQRQAQLTSSFLTLSNLNEDSAGKYICLAEAADGYKSAARGLFLVRQQDPRIISTNQQWAYLGAQQIQIECLAQISTNDDNQTQIVWTKDGKQIKEMHKMSNNNNLHQLELNNNNYFANDFERKVDIITQRSPDLLFMRSVIRIFGPEIQDFGKYNCFIINSIGNDSMDIYFDLRAPESSTFNQLAYVTIGSVCVFFVLISWLIACAPCQRLDSSLAKLTTAAAGVISSSPQTDKMGDVLDGAKSSRHHHPKRQHSLNSPNASSTTSSSSTTTTTATSAVANDGRRSMQQQQQQRRQLNNESLSQSGSCDAVMGSNELLAAAANQQQQNKFHQTLPTNFAHQEFVVSPALNSMMLREQQMSMQHQLQQRPESAFEHRHQHHHQQAAAYQQQQGQQFAMNDHHAIGAINNRHQFRSSLRQLNHHQSSRFQSAAAAATANSTSPSKFAAIHESLENKLQFGPTFTRPTNFVKPISEFRQQQQQQQLQIVEDGQEDKKAAANEDDSDCAAGKNVIVNNEGYCDEMDRFSVSKQNQAPLNSQQTRLINRIWSRLQMKSMQQQQQKNQTAVLNNNRASRSASSLSKANNKPTISLPMQIQTQSSNNNNNESKTSTTSDIYNNQQTTASISSNKASALSKLNNRHHHLNGQISSSQANLIQDNTTSASDGTTTGNNSGRSSSTSASNNQQQHHSGHLSMSQQLQQQQQLELANANYATATSTNYHSNEQQASPNMNGWQHLYSASDQLQQQQMMMPLPQDGSEIYTNGYCTTAANNYANESLALNLSYAAPPSYPSQSANHQQQIYSPVVGGGEHPGVVWSAEAVVGGAGLSPPMMIAAHQQQQTEQLDNTLNQHVQAVDQQQQHYQMPILMSESYLAAVSAAVNNTNELARSHYATICNNSVKQHSSDSPISSHLYGTKPQQMDNSSSSYSPTASVTLQADGHCATTTTTKMITASNNNKSILMNGGNPSDGLATHV